MDNEHRPSTFFTNIGNIEIPKAELHATPLPEEKIPAKKKPQWLVPFAIAFVVIQIAAVIVWFGYKQHQIVKTDMNETISKLQIIEKHGYNVKGYYSQVNEQESKMRGPLALVSLGSVKGALASIDAEVSSQYSQLLENEKKELVQKVSVLEKDLTDSSQYSYNSKGEAISYVQDLKEKLSQTAVSMQQVEQYSKEIDTRNKKINTELEAVMKQEFAALETKMSKATYYDLPSHDKLEAYVQKTGGFNENHKATNQQIIAELKNIEANEVTVDKEVEEVKRKVVLNNIDAATKEVDTLLAFFAQRNGYSNEINQLNQYKNNVAQFTPEKAALLSSDQLQKNMDKDLTPLLTIPRQSKLVAEAKERQERLEQQKKLAEEKGIPVPPIDVPKLIVVDVGKQRLYAYENGLSIFDSAVPVTTGMSGFDTVKGQFAIYLKTTNFRMRSPFPGIFYDSMVDYWMPFFQGYGLHDASWRSVYGTMDYPSVGSHGCVNTPLAYMQRLYAWAEVGTTVIVR